jgi:hypothetical protein
LLVRIKSFTFKLTLPVFSPMLPIQVSIEHLQGFHRNCGNNKCRVWNTTKIFKYQSFIEDLWAGWSNIWPRIKHLCKNSKAQVSRWKETLTLISNVRFILFSCDILILEKNYTLDRAVQEKCFNYFPYKECRLK